MSLPELMGFYCIYVKAVTSNLQSFTCKNLDTLMIFQENEILQWKNSTSSNPETTFHGERIALLPSPKYVLLLYLSPPNDCINLGLLCQGLWRKLCKACTSGGPWLPRFALPFQKLPCGHSGVSYSSLCLIFFTG